MIKVWSWHDVEFYSEEEAINYILDYLHEEIFKAFGSRLKDDARREYNYYNENSDKIIDDFQVMIFEVKEEEV